MQCNVQSELGMPGSQIFHDLALNRIRGCGRCPSVNDSTLPIDEELLKVPLRVPISHVAFKQGKPPPHLDPRETKQSRLFVLKPLIHRIGLVPVDVRLFHQRKGDAVIELAEFCYGFVVTRFLSTELAATGQWWAAGKLQLHSSPGYKESRGSPTLCPRTSCTNFEALGTYIRE